MESKKITAENVRNAIIKRQNDFISSLIEKNLENNNFYAGKLLDFSVSQWENYNGIGVKILEEVIENIYEKFGVYIHKEEYKYFICLYPQDMDILNKYPIKNAEVRSICKKKIRDAILSNELYFDKEFAKKILEVEEIISKDEWVEFQKSIIDKTTALMLSKGIAGKSIELKFSIFSEEAIEYAEELGFKVSRKVENKIWLIVPNTLE